MLRRALAAVMLVATIGAVTSRPAFPDTSTLTKPSLFDVAWSDHSAFAVGLVNGEQDALEALTSASVYHADLFIAENFTQLRGIVEICYTNCETVTLDEILFHLFPNLLGGHVVIESGSINGQIAEVIGDLDGSILCVPVPRGLAPGEQAVIRLAFSVEVPTDTVVHYGLFRYAEGVLALSHVLPTIVVYDETGWNADLPPDYGDLLYADCSFYLVQVTAPAGVTLVASGVEIERTETGDEQQVTYAAGPVREFYLAGSKRYTVVSEQVGETVVNSYSSPDTTHMARIALDYAVSALRLYSTWLGGYPYTELDIVPIPMTALGMEYPGVIGTALSFYNNAKVSDTDDGSVDTFELTVAHEVAHQWFYNGVGNDQIDSPWLDESLVQYATWRYYQTYHGAAGYDAFRAWLESRWDRIARAEIPIGLPVRTYTPTEYFCIVYARGPLFLEALASTMGVETFDSFLRIYFETYKWDIATTERFVRLAETQCECELTSLFGAWVYPH